MNLLSSFEYEIRGSASNSSGFWGKFENAGACGLEGDSTLAMVTNTELQCSLYNYYESAKVSQTDQSNVEA